LKTFLENQIFTLDLHGIRHFQVKEVVEDFVLMNQDKTPLIIIKKKTKKMISLVSGTLTSLNVNFENTTYGRIRVNSLDA